MDPYRSNKLNQSILEVLSRLLQVSVKDPRVGFVTINAVQVNRDHSVAQVYWSVLGDDADRKESFAGLKKARGYMMSKLTRTLGLRCAPDLRFVYDDTVAKGLDLDNVLDELANQGEFKSEEEKKRELELEDVVPPFELIKGIREAKSIWIVPHHNPDPDAMGSALALCECLENMGRDVRVVSYVDPPVGFSDMPGFDAVVTDDEAEELFLEEQPETLILVDCHDISRCGPLEKTLDRFETRWCIDHHLVSGRKAPEAGWIEARSCSTCTLIHRVIETLSEGDDEFGDHDFEMTLDMATNIYAGLISDTGSFRFSNTMPLTFELARRLSVMGVDTAWVSRKTMHRHRPEGVALMQKVLATFEYHNNGRILILRATLAMLEETGGNMVDTEGFVNIATAVDGVKYIAFMKEKEAGTWRVSLRVRGEGDVQSLAARYGGGGHKQASGCTISGQGDDVAANLADELGALIGRKPRR
ncbi:MAG: 30S ribosome-binding factor RbfA [bacterium]|nr:30S ribosome-binding factor RbfA [bacterium]